MTTIIITSSYTLVFSSVVRLRIRLAATRESSAYTQEEWLFT